VTRLGVIVLGLLLIGCSRLPERPETSDDWVPEWSITGRLAVANGRDGGSGELRWRQGRQRAHLQFVGALGRGSWELRISPGDARLSLADGSVYRAPDVESLARQYLAWDIPVTSLRYWIEGRPAPGAAHAASRDDEGRLVVLEQLGWTIRFDGQLPTERGERPRKMTARRGEEQVRLLIREWRFESARSELTLAPQ